MCSLYRDRISNQDSVTIFFVLYFVEESLLACKLIFESMLMTAI